MNEPESAAAFFREAIEKGRDDERFGDVAIMALISDLRDTAAAMERNDEEHTEETAEGIAMLAHAADALAYLYGQTLQDNEVIEGLAGDLDRARAENGGQDGDGEERGVPGATGDAGGRCGEG